MAGMSKKNPQKASDNMKSSNRFVLPTTRRRVHVRREVEVWDTTGAYASLQPLPLPFLVQAARDQQLSARRHVGVSDGRRLLAV